MYGLEIGIVFAFIAAAPPGSRLYQIEDSYWYSIANRGFYA